MDIEDFLNHLEYLTAEQIAEGIFKGIVTFDELKKTAAERDLYFPSDKQKSVKALLLRYWERKDREEKEKDDEAWQQVNKYDHLSIQKYLSEFPDGNHADEARDKIQQFITFKSSIKNGKSNRQR